MKKKNLFKEGLFASLLAAHVIIILHILVLAALGTIIILFGGVYHYLPWILGGIAVLLLLTFWTFYRQVKNKSSELHQILSLPQFQDRNVELKLLGGLVSINVQKPETETIDVGHQLPAGSSTPMLEESTNRIQHQLDALTALHEKEIITKEEFDRAKQELRNGN